MQPSPTEDRFAERVCLGFVVLGVALRILRFCLDFPLWGDEVFVCQNFWTRDFRTILNQLENGQICPPLFLWFQLAAFKLFGSSDQAMRLVPLLASIAALISFRNLARAVLAPRPAMIAVGLLSVAAWPMTMATFAKPYSFDLLMAVMLQLAAVQCRQSGERRTRAFVLLALAMPVALLGSYPAAFVGGGVMLALLPVAWRNGVTVKALFVLAGVLMLGAFRFDLQVGKEQFEGEAVPIRNFLLDYWKDAFPPSEWWKWPYWLVEAHTGRMMAYPVGDAYFGSSLTTIFFAVGLYRWCRERRWALLVLFLVPFALNFIATVLQKYPYAACGRLTQHLAPAICLITASGVAHVIEWWFKLPSSQRLALAVVVGLYAAIGLGAAGLWLWRPYHDSEAKWMRDIPREIVRQADSQRDTIRVVGGENQTENVLRWYLKRTVPRPQWIGTSEDLRVAEDNRRVWVVETWADDEKRRKEPPRMKPILPAGWIVRGQARYDHRPERDTDPFYHCVITVYGAPDSPPAMLNSQP